MLFHKKNQNAFILGLLGLIWLLGLSSCGPSQVDFAVKHLVENAGEQIVEHVSYQDETGLDNSSGNAPLQIEIRFERNYRYQIIERITKEGLDSQRVKNKIVELYKLPPNDPEGTTQTALCPLSIIVPAGKKASITVEWTERWAEGIINEGVEGQGDQLGTYAVFLGYFEPCSLVDQKNSE
jgi:hypothetical protein